MTGTYEQSENKRFKKIFGLWVGSFGNAPDGEAKTTVEELSNITGIGKDTVKSHLRHDGSIPTWANLKIYMKVLPHGFASALLFDCGFEVTACHEHDLPAGGALLTELAHGVAQLAEDLKDGIHDDVEKRKIAPRLLTIGADCTALGHQWGGMVAPIRKAI